MNRRLDLALVATLIAALAACSHGGGTSLPAVQGGGSGTIAVGNPSRGGAKTTLAIRVPASLKSSNAQKRTPQYVSPSTLGASITVYGALATPPPTPTVVADLSSSSPLCTPNSDGSRTCNVQVQAPVGNDDFIVNTYDQAPVNGAIPSGANLLSTSTLQFVIQAGQVNTLPLTLGGVPAAIVLAPPGFLVPPNQTSTFTFTVNAKDADGNYIVGPGNYNAPITLSISGDPNNTISLSTTTIASPATSTVTATYNGGALPGTATITGSAAGATSGSLTVQASSSVTTVTIIVPGFQSAAIWISDPAWATNSILRYAANANGTAVPTTVVDPGAYPVAIALDSSGYEYVLTQDNTIRVYAPNANGSATPVRQIEVAGSPSLGCPTALALAGGNLYIADCGGLLFVLPASANGQTTPTAIISGGSTMLTGPNSVAVDAGGNIYVGNGGSAGGIAEFAPNANGNVSPTRFIAESPGGIDTGGVQGFAVDNSGTLYVATAGVLDVFGPSDNGAVPADRTISNSAACGPMGVALDGLGNVWVANDCGPVPNQAPLVAFPIGASGNTTPSAVISGSATGLFNSGPWVRIAVDGSNNVYEVNNELGTVTEYAAGANGNAAPAATLVTAQPYMDSPKGIAFDAAGNLYAAASSTRTIAVYAPGSTGSIAPTSYFFPQSNCDLQGVAVDTYGNIYVSDLCANNIAVYAKGSTGYPSPRWVIQGPATELGGPDQIALDTANNLYVANANANSVTIYAAGVQGNAAPMRAIAGSNTGIVHPTGIALDSLGYIYVFSTGPTPAVLVFSPNASGNIAPIRAISGGNTELCSCSGGFLAVDSQQNIYTTNAGAIRIFGAAANGNVAPYRSIFHNGNAIGIAISPTQP